MTASSLISPPPGQALATAKLLGATMLALAAWFAVYWQLEPFSIWAVARLPIAHASHREEALRFFIFDTPKVLMLLALVVFAMGVVRSFFSPERTRALLAGRVEGWTMLRRPAWVSSRRSAPARPCLCSSDSSRPAFPSSSPSPS